MLHVPGMPEGVHVSFSPEHGPALSTAQPDPVFALIEAHRAAYAAWEPLAAVWNEASSTAEFDAAKAAAEEPGQREKEAFHALLTAKPSTAASLWALTAYLPEVLRKVSVETDTEAQVALDALREGALRLGLATVAAETKAVRSAALAAHVDPHLVLVPALRQAFAWTRDAQVIENESLLDSSEHAAARAVLNHCWDLADRVLALPAPQTPAGLGVVALAMTVWCEGSIGRDPEMYQEERRTASGVRAMLSVAGVEPLTEWHGFGDEPDSDARWDAMRARVGEGSLPAWALAGKSGPDEEEIATGEEAALAATPALAAPAHPPVSDLARACIEQVERMAQWGQRDKSVGLSDEELDADLDAWGAALQRAVEEPSASAADLAAKARLLRADMEQFKREEECTQASERLMLVILSEIEAQTGKPALDAEGAAGKVEASTEMLPAPDLSGCSVSQLARLYEVFQGTYDHISALGQLGCFWTEQHGFNPAGDIIDREVDRLGAMIDVCANEVARRSSAPGFERNDALCTRVAHEMRCNGRIHDPALMRDIATAWGA